MIVRVVKTEDFLPYDAQLEATNVSTSMQERFISFLEGHIFSVFIFNRNDRISKF